MRGYREQAIPSTRRRGESQRDERGPRARVQVSGLWSQVLVSSLWSLVSGPGLWSQVPGLWSQVLVSGLRYWSQVSGLRYWSWSLVSGPGPWSLDSKTFYSGRLLSLLVDFMTCFKCSFFYCFNCVQSLFSIHESKGKDKRLKKGLKDVFLL